MSKKSANRKRYTDEFKAKALRLVQQRGSRTIAEVAESIGMKLRALHASDRSVYGSRRIAAEIDEAVRRHRVPRLMLASHQRSLSMAFRSSAQQSAAYAASSL